MASNLQPEHYYSEGIRLETFRRWTKKNPKPSALASAGLFYEGNRDYVKCAFCKGVIDHNPLLRNIDTITLVAPGLEIGKKISCHVFLPFLLRVVCLSNNPNF